VDVACKAFFDKYSIMLLDELSRPKIGKDIESTAFDYFNQRKTATSSEQAEAMQLALLKKLKVMGWKKIGEGTYSYVFENSEKPYILKVNKREDKGFMAYAELIKKSRNPHFPKISDRKSLEVEDVDGYRRIFQVYLIEKLRVMPAREAIDVSYDLERIVLYPYHTLEQVFTNSVRGAVGNIGGKVPDYLRRNPLLVTACQIVGRHMKTFGMRSDLHEENIMERADGTTVITDPYATIAG